MTDKLINDLAAGTVAATTELEQQIAAATESTKTTVGAILDLIAGDVNVSSTGASTYNAGSIVDADVNASAAIASSKLAGVFSLVSGSAAASTNNTAEFYFFGVSNLASSTESDMAQTLDFPFTLRRITSRVTANTKDGDTTINLRDDGASTAGTITIAAAATGIATTGAISNAVASGSVVNWQVDKSLSSSGSITTPVISAEFSQP